LVSKVDESILIKEKAYIRGSDAIFYDKPKGSSLSLDF
jgi:hypothetical protein